MAKPNFLPLYRDVVEALLEAELSGSEYRALMMIVLEHLKHAGKENGKLVVIHADFAGLGGIDRKSVAGAIRGLEAKGFIEVKGGEYNPKTGRRHCLKFNLSFLDRTNTSQNFGSLPPGKTGLGHREKRYNRDGKNGPTGSMGKNGPTI